MVLGFFVLILTFSLAASCPQSLSPDNYCKCNIETNERTATRNVVVQCSDVRYVSDLKSSIREFWGLTIHKLKIVDSDLDYLPHNLFRGVTVELLFFQRTRIKSFSDAGVAFRGLQDSLEQLEISECRGLFSWDWSLFKNLRKLWILKIMSSDLKAIVEDVNDDNSLNVESVLVSKTQLSYLGDYAFAKFEELRYINLCQGRLREVKRSMLPNPANKLYTIILNDNKLTTLPDDFFTNMPELHHLKLSGNKFTTLKEETFEPIWQQLYGFEAINNQLVCDCRLKWILKKPEKLISERVDCFKPGEFEEVPVTDLQPSDLQC